VVNDEDSKLLCVDFICHGVPSPVAWKQYIKEVERSKNSHIQRISFRNKDQGWRNYSVMLSFESGSDSAQASSQNRFMQGFIQNLFLRESCSKCCFRGLRSGADITLGDFWNVEKYFPDLSDDRGVSVVMINSRLGKELWKTVCQRVGYHPTNYTAVLETNPLVVASIKHHRKRKTFFAMIAQNSFSSVVTQCLRPDLLITVRHALSRLLKKCKKEFVI
jgi:hypothetical protein